MFRLGANSVLQQVGVPRILRTWRESLGFHSVLILPFLLEVHVYNYLVQRLLLTWLTRNVGQVACISIDHLIEIPSITTHHHILKAKFIISNTFLTEQCPVVLPG
jgi:hypothetical protein